MSEQITTAAELDALPVGSVVLDLGPDRAEANAPVIACKAADGMWWVAGTPRDRRWRSFEVIRDAEGSVLVCTHRPDAPVTAGGSVTEWGVRLVRRDGVEQVQRHTDEREARASHAVNEQWFAEGDPAWCVVWKRSEVVSRQVTEWTVVDGTTEGGGA